MILKDHRVEKRTRIGERQYAYTSGRLGGIWQHLGLL